MIRHLGNYWLRMVLIPCIVLGVAVMSFLVTGDLNLRLVMIGAAFIFGLDLIAFILKADSVIGFTLGRPWSFQDEAPTRQAQANLRALRAADACADTYRLADPETRRQAAETVLRSWQNSGMSAHELSALLRKLN